MTARYIKGISKPRPPVARKEQPLGARVDDLAWKNRVDVAPLAEQRLGDISQYAPRERSGRVTMMRRPTILELIEQRMRAARDFENALFSETRPND